jgi:hypothetical protein
MMSTYGEILMRHITKNLFGYTLFIIALYSIFYATHAEKLNTTQNNIISRHSIQQPIDETYDDIIDALINEGFSIVKEINIGKNLDKASKEHNWKNYNNNNLVGIRTAIVCSGMTVNAIGNADPNMISICPLHVTLTQTGNWTKIDFIRPSIIAKGTPAENVAKKLEYRLKSAIQKGISQN